jgi:hypothetical protein
MWHDTARDCAVDWSPARSAHVVRLWPLCASVAGKYCVSLEAALAGLRTVPGCRLCQQTLYD